jgi:hypothetical protein
MWGIIFVGSHKTAKEGVCVLGLLCFSLAVWVWCEVFSPHAVHGFMLK